MRDAGVKPIVFSSTCAVYGVPERTPLDEGMPTQPINPYGESKLAFERALAWFHRAHGLKVVALRYFNAAGAGERSGERHEPETHLIPLVLEAAAGRGRTSRFSATTIRRATARACATTSTCSTWPTRTCWRWIFCARSEPRMEIYNLGCGGDGHTNREVVSCAEKVTGKRIATVVGPRRPGDPPVLVASSEKARRELGWKPTRERLDVIIESAWKWKGLKARSPEPSVLNS